MANSSSFDDYVKGLKQLDNEDNRVELESFYALNSGVLQFFKGIDKSIQDILSKLTISPTVVKQLESALPLLHMLKAKISSLEPTVFATIYANEINKAILYAKSKMTLFEVADFSQVFFDLLSENQKAFIEEQKEIAKQKKEEGKKIAEDKEQKIIRRYDLRSIAVAKDTETPLCVLKAMIERGMGDENPEEGWPSGEDEYKLLVAILQNPQMPLDVLRHYLTHDRYNDENHGFCDAISDFSDTALLKILSKDKESGIRLCVACNKHIPDELLLDLTIDKDSFVSDVATSIYSKRYAPSKSGCFVATACYGNYDAPEVLVLRRYRDERLLTNWLGTLFVRFYYFVSPPLARQIAKSESVKTFIRRYFLRPIINRIY